MSFFLLFVVIVGFSIVVVVVGLSLTPPQLPQEYLPEISLKKNNFTLPHIISYYNVILSYYIHPQIIIFVQLLTIEAKKLTYIGNHHHKHN